MNFFAHALVASWRSVEPRFVLGAMLPDLSSMIGVRITHAADAELERGIQLHHATDAAFHSAPIFTGLCSEAIEALGALGVERGCSRAVGHVGVELLLDGSLSGDRSARQTYRDALAVAELPDFDRLVHTVEPSGSVRLRAGLVRLAAAPLPEAYREADFVAQRLRGILASRPRLAMRPGDFEHIQRWAQSVQPRVFAQRNELLDQVRSRLST
jgi:acyl carrier protein phosphodiesterase